MEILLQKICQFHIRSIAFLQAKQFIQTHGLLVFLYACAFIHVCACVRVCLYWSWIWIKLKPYAMSIKTVNYYWKNDIRLIQSSSDCIEFILGEWKKSYSSWICLRKLNFDLHHDCIFFSLDKKDKITKRTHTNIRNGIRIILFIAFFYGICDYNRCHHIKTEKISWK